MTNLLKRSPWAVPKHPMTQWVLGDELTWPAPEKLDNWKKHGWKIKDIILGCLGHPFFGGLLQLLLLDSAPKSLLHLPHRCHFHFRTRRWSCWCSASTHWSPRWSPVSWSIPRSWPPWRLAKKGKPALCPRWQILHISNHIRSYPHILLGRS